jgi:hypothetical protein
MFMIFPFVVTVVLRPEEVTGLVPVCACTDAIDMRLKEKMHKRMGLYTFSLGQRSRVGLNKKLARLMVHPPYALLASPHFSTVRVVQTIEPDTGRLTRLDARSLGLVSCAVSCELAGYCFFVQVIGIIKGYKFQIPNRLA